jgi:hypothetical protein
LITDKVSSWLTIDQAADLLETSPGRVRRLIDEHFLFTYRIDKVPMIPLSSIHGTLILLNDLGLSRDESIVWLYELNSELGTEPITALLAGHKAPVRRAAQGLG